MSNILHIINKEIEKKNISKAEFSRRVGVSRASLYTRTEDSLKISTLRKIADVLNIPIANFFLDNEQKVERGKKAKVVLELNDTDILNIDIENRKLEIIKK